jgi:hypothetical protein
MGLLQTTIRNRSRNVPIAIEMACVLAGLRAPKVFSWLKGMNTLDNEEIGSLDRVLRDLQSLVELAKPFSLRFDDLRRTQFLLERFRQGDIDRALTPYVKVLAEELEAAGL